MQKKETGMTMNQKYGKRARGFTLIEISIVVVVIGLLAGSIAVGVSMVRHAEVRRALTDIDRIAQAMQMFEEKYIQLPGDFTDAESLWGADSACPNTASNTVIKKATCDGDGNGIIDNNYEAFRAFQQMANAQVLDGGYTGVTGPGGAADWVPDVNCPAGIRNSCYGIGSATIAATSACQFAVTKFSHFIELGLHAAVAGNSRLPLLTPNEAAEMDAKIDDSLPASGKVQARPAGCSYNPACTTTASEATARYNVADNTSPRCGLLYYRGY